MSAYVFHVTRGEWWICDTCGERCALTDDTDSTISVCCGDIAMPCEKGFYFVNNLDTQPSV
jgi:hypothetical protein